MSPHTTLPSAPRLTRDQLDAALLGMTESDQQLFAMRIYEGLSHAEISQRGFEGLDERGVRKRFSKLVERLRTSPQVQQVLRTLHK